MFFLYITAYQDDTLELIKKTTNSMTCEQNFYDLTCSHVAGGQWNGHWVMFIEIKLHIM